MSEQLHKALFSNSNCLTDKQLYNYIDNKLTVQEKYVVEKHLLDCELCAEALEGLSLVKNRNIIEETVKAVKTKYSTKSEKKETVIIPFDFKRKFAIAASILLLIGSSFIYIYYFNTAGNDLAQNNMSPPLPIVKNNEPVIEEENETTAADPLSITATEEKESVINKRSKYKSREEKQDGFFESPTELDLKKDLKRDDADANLSSTSGADQLYGGKQIATGDEIIQNQKTVENDLRENEKVQFENPPSGNSKDKALAAKAEEEPQNKRGETLADIVGFAKKAKEVSSPVSPVSAPAKESALSQTQTTSTGNTSVDVTKAAVIVPQYKEGYEAMQKFIKDNTDLSNCKDCKGTVSLRFIVKADGTLTTIKAIKEVKKCKCLTTEAIRIIQKMPAWIPAQKAGANVDYEYTLPVTF